MKNKAILLSTILAVGLAAGTSFVSAQPRGGPGWGMMGPGWGPGMMGRDWPAGPRGMMGMGCPMFGYDDDATGFTEGRIAFIKAELGITEAQKAVWDGYVQALKINFVSMQGMHQQMRTLFEAKSPVERLDARIAAMDGRLSALKEMKPALEKLYDALEAKQREKADELLTVMGCMM